MTTVNDAAFTFLTKANVDGFSEGRTFRSFKVLNIPASSTYVVKITLPKPVLFTGFDITIDSGTLQVDTVAGGASGGTFAETLPIIKTNLTTPTAHVPTTVLTAGGTHTGGTVIDSVRQKADGNATRSSSVIQSDTQVRGIAAGTYHWRFNNLSTDAITGTLKILWEELPEA